MRKAGFKKQSTILDGTNVVIVYSKKEASLIKQSFWTAFGQYMSPILSSEGEKKHWVNYKTGFRSVFIRMDVDIKIASIWIELNHTDIIFQELFFDRLHEYKSILESIAGSEWNWEKKIPDKHGKIVSRIYSQINGVNIFKQEDWPAIISFLKPRIIALDEFWNNVKYGLEDLQ